VLVDFKGSRVEGYTPILRRRLSRVMRHIMHFEAHPHLCLSLRQWHKATHTPTHTPLG